MCVRVSDSELVASYPGDFPNMVDNQQGHTHTHSQVVEVKLTLGYDNRPVKITHNLFDTVSSL